jgi:hypothetical protein
MRIVFDSSSIHQRAASLPITGILYFEVAGRSFPDERWSDFPVVITSWWLDGVKNLQANPESEALFRFMDGPYFIGVRLSGHLVNLRYVEDRLVQIALHEEQVALAVLVSALQSLARNVAEACERGGLSCPELRILRTYLPN